VISPSFDIIVVASHLRPPLITEHLNGIEHQVWWSKDYDTPEIKKSKRAEALPMPDGHGPYRCFRAHQDATLLAKKDAMLIFEDDAVPSHPDWLEVAERSIHMLDKFQIVSLHGRHQQGVSAQVTSRGVAFNILREVKVNGVVMISQLSALAYLIRPETAAKLRACQWEGFPYDFVICNDFSFCVLSRSPFNHDRRHGSLVETV
jgi:hypothetical protein